MQRIEKCVDGRYDKSPALLQQSYAFRWEIALFPVTIQSRLFREYAKVTKD